MKVIHESGEVMELRDDVQLSAFLSSDGWTLVTESPKPEKSAKAEAPTKKASVKER